MAIRLPSLVQVSATVWSGDDALDLPDLHAYYKAQSGKMAARQKKDLSIEELESLIKKHDEERAALGEKAKADIERLNVARETGDYGPIIKSGESPTWFHFRVIPGGLLREFRSALMANEVSDFKIPALAFRLAIEKIENLDGVKVERVEDKAYGKIAKASIIDALDMISSGIVNELGGWALDRSVPKSA